MNRQDFVEALIASAVIAIGEREDPPGSNRGPEIEKYLRGWNCRYIDTYIQGAKWCGLFVEYHVRSAYHSVGAVCPISDTYYLAAASQWAKLGADKGWGVAVPQRGDIAVMVRRGEPEHVCIVKSVSAVETFIETIDGNSGDGVRLRVRPLAAWTYSWVFVRLPVG